MHSLAVMHDAKHILWHTDSREFTILLWLRLGILSFERNSTVFSTKKNGYFEVGGISRGYCRNLLLSSLVSD